VEEFSATGAFIRAFGHPNPASGATADSFYGPRQLAVAPNGDIYVADTGNERIQVYSPQGRHLFNIGSGSHGPQTALGRFDEPSGVAIDRHGVVYVADYWDKRIQRFTLDGKPLGPAFPIAGWATGDYGEPYLAVDNRGHLFATDAPAANTHAAHVLEVDAATGRVIRAFGAAGPSASALVQPSGIAVDRGGALYIADAGAARLLRVQP
jgi:sugar lactone lactonase YvrE